MNNPFNETDNTTLTMLRARMQEQSAYARANELTKDRFFYRENTQGTIEEVFAGVEMYPELDILALIHVCAGRERAVSRQITYNAYKTESLVERINIGVDIRQADGIRTNSEFVLAVSEFGCYAEVYRGKKWRMCSENDYAMAARILEDVNKKVSFAMSAVEKKE